MKMYHKQREILYLWNFVLAQFSLGKMTLLPYLKLEIYFHKAVVVCHQRYQIYYVNETSFLGLSL